MTPQRRRVLATAGHVDHGKSVLVQALTGTHPDRLPEERARGMSIDLGFAFWNLPDGTPVGIVDVPGHRDFIANMLAGVGWVDAVLLVIAVDEGVMPQTREHLAILDLLGIGAGVVALTKADLAPDAAWLARREAEARALLAGTTLAHAPVVAVSARTGYGMAALKAALARVLQQAPARLDLGRPRLAVDRAFEVRGFGPVVTGTLVDGPLRVGMQVQVLPEGLRARVRGLQSHHQPVEAVAPAARVAVNLAGVSRVALHRGQWLVLPGDDEPTRALDVQLRVLPDAPPLRHNAVVRLHLAAAQVMARVRVLGAEAVAPGETGFVQLRLERPVVARRGDRFVLRRPSPAMTWAGGRVLDPHPPRHKRWAPATGEHLQALAADDLAAALLARLQLRGWEPAAALVRWARRPEAEARAALARLEAAGQALQWRGREGAYVVAAAQLARWNRRARQVLAAFHGQHPQRRGMPTPALVERVGVPRALGAAWLRQAQAQGVVRVLGDEAALPEHSPRLPPSLARAEARLLAALQQPRTWPAAKRLRDLVGPAAFRALLEAGRLVPLSPQVVVPVALLDAWEARLRAAFPRGGFGVAQARDALGLSRRYTLALLEYWDARGVTCRGADDTRQWCRGDGSAGAYSQ